MAAEAATIVHTPTKSAPASSASSASGSATNGDARSERGRKGRGLNVKHGSEAIESVKMNGNGGMLRGFRCMLG